MDTLPDKPSALIRLAIQDVEKLEAARPFGLLQELQSTDWHSPVKTLAQVHLLDLMKKMEVDATVPEVDCKLRALDLFRTGSVAVGLVTMGLEHPQELAPYIEVHAYLHHPEAFKADMLALADRLEGVGL